MSDTDYTFDTIEIDPAETRKVELDLFFQCANFWQPNEAWLDGDTIRPTRSTGFAYRSNGGLSGAREPIWPKVIGSTVTDGSTTWTCIDAGLNGILAISSPSATSDPTGLTISSVSVSESTKILAQYSGGQLDQDYDAVFTFTLDAVPRVARQTVQIRKR